MSTKMSAFLQPLPEDDVQMHVATIRMAVDDDSPFKGMIDLGDLTKMPTKHALQVWDAMGDDLQKRFQKIYMPSDEEREYAMDIVKQMKGVRDE